MKIHIEVDLTPEELRTAAGLPDVKSVQDRWMKKIEERMAEEIDKFSPESVFNQWTNALTPNQEFIQSFFNAAMTAKNKK